MLNELLSYILPKKINFRDIFKFFHRNNVRVVSQEFTNANIG